MGDEPEPYTLTLPDGKKETSSRGYTGKGLALYSNQDTYQGDFLDGIRQGKGKYSYFEKGDWYEGDFCENKKHGIGKYNYKGVGEYIGHFENNKRHGEGVFTYQTGDKYVGWFKYGKKHGKGVYEFNQTAIKLQGEWNNGNLETGVWMLPNGTYYEGAFTNNKPNGNGVWYFRNNGQKGNQLEGSFTQKKIENEDNPDEKPMIKLDWSSKQCLYESAIMINAHEKF